MEQSRAEVRWGDALNVGVTGASSLDGRKRLVQVDERYSRAWLLRYHVSVSRPLLPGELVNAAFTFSEGVGSSAVRYRRVLTILPPNAENGPVSEWIACVQMTVDCELINSGVSDTLSLVASAWISPISPVYPLARGEGL